MNKYIDRKAIIEKLKEIGGCDASDDFGKGWDKAVDTAIEAVEKLPAADAVKVVHCKDCRYRDFLDSDYGGYCCEIVKREVQLDDYCSFGERRNGND